MKDRLLVAFCRPPPPEGYKFVTELPERIKLRFPVQEAEPSQRGPGVEAGTGQLPAGEPGEQSQSQSQPEFPAPAPKAVPKETVQTGIEDVDQHDFAFFAWEVKKKQQSRQQIRLRQSVVLASIPKVESQSSR